MDPLIEENKAVVMRFVQEFKNQANHAIVAELYTPNFIHHFRDPRIPEGREGLKQLGRTVHGAFPDVRVTVEDLFGEGDRVVERSSVRATHKGEFNGVSATGKQVGWTETHIYRFENGKIAELWSEVDFLGLLMQLGAIPR